MTTSNEELDDQQMPENLPPPDEPVWVQCEGFRCLAYLDKHGHWRGFYDRSKLTGKIKMIVRPPGSN